jgi:DNA-binding transcriptional MerR regulator
MVSKNTSAFVTIGELAKYLDLIDEKTKKPKTHVIRFWEKNFKLLKPSLILNKHRYYSDKDIEIFKRVKFLLKEQGMTIKGANKLLDEEYSVDYKNMNNISSANKLLKLRNIIKDIKKIL